MQRFFHHDWPHGAFEVQIKSSWFPQWAVLITLTARRFVFHWFIKFWPGGRKPRDEDENSTEEKFYELIVFAQLLVVRCQRVQRFPVQNGRPSVGTSPLAEILHFEIVFLEADNTNHKLGSLWVAQGLGSRRSPFMRLYWKPYTLFRNPAIKRSIESWMTVGSWDTGDGWQIQDGRSD